MKHIEKYKIFESKYEIIDTQTIKNILLDIMDIGFKCAIQTRWANNMGYEYYHIHITLYKDDLSKEIISQNVPIIKSCISRIRYILKENGFDIDKNSYDMISQDIESEDYTKYRILNPIAKELNLNFSKRI